MKLPAIINTAMLLLFISCSSVKEVTKTTTPLYGTKWSLTNIHNETGVEAVNNKAFIRFDREKKSAGGNASCNTFGSTAIINNNEVRFTNIFSTKMYCEGVQKTEDAFLQQLNKVTLFQITGSNLLLYQDKNILLVFTVATD